jgi:hypothetical protein
MMMMTMTMMDRGLRTQEEDIEPSPHLELSTGSLSSTCTLHKPYAAGKTQGYFFESSSTLSCFGGVSSLLLQMSF